MQNLIEEMYKMLPSLPTEISTLVPKNLDKIYAECKREDELMQAEFNVKMGELTTNPGKKYIGTMELANVKLQIYMTEEDTKDPSKIDFDNRIFEGIANVDERSFRGTFKLLSVPNNTQVKDLQFLEGIVQMKRAVGKYELTSTSRMSQADEGKPKTIVARMRDQGSTVVKTITYIKHNDKSAPEIKEYPEPKKLDFFIPNGPDVTTVLTVIRNPAGGVNLVYRNVKPNDSTKTVITSLPRFSVTSKEIYYYLYPTLTSADNGKHKGILAKQGYKYVGEVDGKLVPNGHGKQIIEPDAQNTLVLEGQFVNNLFVEGRMVGGDALFEGKFEGPDSFQGKGKGRLLLGIREQFFDEHFNRIKPGQSRDPSLKYFSIMYEGEVLNLLMHGKGILHVEQGTTEGEFMNHKPVGRHIQTDLQGIQSEVFYDAAPSSNHSPSQMPPSQHTHKFSSRPLIQTPHLTSYLHSTISVDLAASDRTYRRMIISYQPPRTMTHPRYLTQLFRFGLRILK